MLTRCKNVKLMKSFSYISNRNKTLRIDMQIPAFLQHLGLCGHLEDGRTGKLRHNNNISTFYLLKVIIYHSLKTVVSFVQYRKCYRGDIFSRNLYNKLVGLLKRLAPMHLSKIVPFDWSAVFSLHRIDLRSIRCKFLV